MISENNKNKNSKSSGRWTASRQSILDIFKKTGEHLTAEDVFMHVKRAGLTMGLATVYRNLEFLKDQGLIKRYQFGEGRAKYELSSEEEHHHHLICTGCLEVRDYSEFVERELKLIQDIQRELSDKYDFEIDSHQLHFYGECNSCRKK